MPISPRKNIGPIERYQDNILGTKRYFSAWFLYKNSLGVKKYEDIWKKLIEISKQREFYFPLNPDMGKLSSPYIFMGDMIAESGEVSKINTTGWSRPENVETARKYGTVKMICVDKYSKKINKLKKYLKRVSRKYKLDKNVADRVQEYLEEYPLLDVVLHEYAHTFIKPQDANIHLENYYTIIEEPRAEINMLYLSGILEIEKNLTKGTAQDLFIFVILLFEYLYNEVQKISPSKMVYLYSTTLWIYKALQYKIINVMKNKISFDLKKMDQLLPLFTMEILMFFNSIAYFGYKTNPYFEKYKKFGKEYGDKIYKLLN